MTLVAVGTGSEHDERAGWEKSKGDKLNHPLHSLHYPCTACAPVHSHISIRPIVLCIRIN